MNDDSIHISSHLLDELIADIDNTKEQIDNFHNSPSTDVNEDNLEQYDYDINEDEIINEINPNLIGGVQIIMDDASIDASIKGTLDKIRGTL